VIKRFYIKKGGKPEDQNTFSQKERIGRWERGSFRKKEKAPSRQTERRSHTADEPEEPPFIEEARDRKKTSSHRTRKGPTARDVKKERPESRGEKGREEGNSEKKARSPGQGA